MFNPEKLLGGMLRSGMRGRGVGSILSGGAALGLLGVAMEAVEHYMNKPQVGGQSAPASEPPPAPQSGGIPPQSVGGPPPPPPGGSTTPPPPPNPAAGIQDIQEAANPQTDAVLLIRAMIAAANADGVIDAQERGQIMDKLKTVDLSAEEHQFIVNELLAPQEVQSIVAGVRSPEMARQIYAASLLAITVDTLAEQQYLSSLAQQLGLDTRTVEDIHRQLGR